MKNIETVQTQFTMARRFFGLILPMLTMVAMLAAVPKEGIAQCPSNNCPPDDGNGCWYENNALWTIYSGCQVDVDYCYRQVISGGITTYEYIVNYIQVESGCSDMAMSTLMADVAYQLYQTISSLPECPSSGVLVAVSANNCWKYDPNPTHFGNSNISPGIGGYLPCGSGTCTKTCSICFGWDPVTSTYHDFISDCGYVGYYTSGSCIEEEVNIFEFTPLACYHLPCGW